MVVRGAQILRLAIKIPRISLRVVRWTSVMAGTTNLQAVLLKLIGSMVTLSVLRQLLQARAAGKGLRMQRSDSVLSWRL